MSQGPTRPRPSPVHCISCMSFVLWTAGSAIFSIKELTIPFNWTFARVVSRREVSHLQHFKLLHWSWILANSAHNRTRASRSEFSTIFIPSRTSAEQLLQLNFSQFLNRISRRASVKLQIMSSYTYRFVTASCASIANASRVHNVKTKVGFK